MLSYARHKFRSYDKIHSTPVFQFVSICTRQHACMYTRVPKYYSKLNLQKIYILFFYITLQPVQKTRMKLMGLDRTEFLLTETGVKFPRLNFFAKLKMSLMVLSPVSRDSGSNIKYSGFFYSSGSNAAVLHLCDSYRASEATNLARVRFFLPNYFPLPLLLRKFGKDFLSKLVS